jgi:hypothetical protein
MGSVPLNNVEAVDEIAHGHAFSSGSSNIGEVALGAGGLKRDLKAFTEGRIAEIGEPVCELARLRK